MTGPDLVLGVDPGRTTGICLFAPAERTAELAQLSPGLVPVLLDGLIGEVAMVAVEEYVIGPRSARSSDAGAGAVTRELIGALRAWAGAHDVPCRVRSAAYVKPWATDARLTAAGITAPRGTGMRHALDGGRHALFAARSDLGFPDPLSRSTSSPRCPR